MPIYSAWDDAAETVVRLTFDDEWTIEDLRTAYDQARELIAAAPGSQPVDLILDFELSGPVPTDTLRAIVRLFQQTREPVGALVYFGGPRMIGEVAGLMGVLRQLVGIRVFRVDSLVEARAFLAARRRE